MRINRRFSLFGFLALLAACTSNPYPYPPQFVASEPMTVLAAPPSRGSKQYNEEIDQIIAKQAKLTQAEKSAIIAENRIQPEMLLLPVLGKAYTEERYPALYSLLKHGASDAWRIGDEAQDYWQSPRPWYADDRVQLLVPSITRPGYPSGHTTTNCVWAHILSDLFPAKKSAFFKRAVEIGNHRVDGGAHFPHDITAGQKLADVIYRDMKKSAQFQREYAAAKAELRR